MPLADSVVTLVLLESLPALLVAWAAAQFGLICLWSWRRSRGTARAAWIGFGLLPALAGASILIVTDKERMIRVCHDMARAVEEADVDAIAARLSPELRAGGLEREAFLDRLRGALTKHRLKWVELSRFDRTDVDGRMNGATLEFNATCDVSTSDAAFERLRTRWRLSFEWAGHRWFVTRMEALPTPFSPIRDLDDFLR